MIQGAFLAAALIAAVLAVPATADTYPRPFGTFTALAGTDTTDCVKIPGHTCKVYKVTGCPGLIGGRKLFIGTRRPPTGLATRGVVVTFSGGSGKRYWGAEGPYSKAWIDNVVNAGMISAQVRWNGKWFQSNSGELAGPGAVTCRPATVVDWLYTDLYQPLVAAGLNPADGRCGFCVVGSSMGSTVPVYLIEHFGMDSWIDGVFPTGGPIHAELARGCRGEQGFNYGAEAEEWVDPTYGYVGGGGPCETHNLTDAWSARWTEDGLDTAGDHFHPTTRVVIFVGELDPKLHKQAQFWEATLEAAGTPEVTLDIVPGMKHSIKGSQQGMNELQDAVLLT